MDAINKKLEIARLFTEVSKILKHGMRKCFDNVGITLPQGLVIGTLTKCGEMKITELSQKINLSNSTISGIIDRLEKQQLVVRTRSVKDRRIVYVKVTPKAEEFFQGIHEKTEEHFAGLLSLGTPKELEEISRGLSTLKMILNDRN